MKKFYHLNKVRTWRTKEIEMEVVGNLYENIKYKSKEIEDGKRYLLWTYLDN